MGSFVFLNKLLLKNKFQLVSCIFNVDQSGIYYENLPNKTIDFTGSKEIPVSSQKGEKKRPTLFSTINAVGDLFKQLIVFKGTPNARVHAEVRGYDDTNTIHTCQINSWTDTDVLAEWHEKVWTPIAQSIEGPKLLIMDLYPLHRDAFPMLSQYETTVLYIPAGLTFNLQPLDSGFFKVLKDELKKLWIRDWEINTPTERHKRFLISSQLKELWTTMKNKRLSVYWDQSCLSYPYFEVFAARNRANHVENSSFLDFTDDTRMTIEQIVPIGSQMTADEDTTMIIEDDNSQIQEKGMILPNTVKQIN